MIGIIILNYNTAEDVMECVNSIHKTTKANYKIYVVDNKSTDGSVETLREKLRKDPLVELLVTDYNGGYSFGNNIGIKKAINDGAQYILISNPDVVYYDGAIDIMLADLISDSEIGVIGPSTPSLDQEESQLLRKVYTPSVYVFSKKPFLYLSKVFKGLKTEFAYPKDNSVMPYKFKGMVRGCSFLISSELFQSIGLFDDNVFLYSEEWIIAKKLSDLGLFCAYDTRAKALHKEATSTSQAGTGFQSYHLYLSAFYYLKEYTNCNKATLTAFYCQNMINYAIKSLRNDSYRALIGKFAKTQTKLFLGKTDFIR